MFNQNKDYTYIHIPKTGGNTIKEYIKNYKNINYYEGFYINEVGKKCLWAHTKPTNFSKRYFSSIRNPFSWLTSLWFYNFSKVPNGKISMIRNIFDNDFEKYIFEFNSESKIGSNFWDNGIGFNIRKFYAFQTFNEKKSFVDFYIKLENINEFLLEFGLKNENDEVVIKNKNGDRPWTSKYKDYKSLYSKKMIDHVYRFREKEFKLFGYNFDGSVDSKPTISLLSGHGRDDKLLK